MSTKKSSGSKTSKTAPVRLDRNIKGQSKGGHGNKGAYQ